MLVNVSMKGHLLLALFTNKGHALCFSNLKVDYEEWFLEALVHINLIAHYRSSIRDFSACDPVIKGIQALETPVTVGSREG